MHEKQFVEHAKKALVLAGHRQTEFLENLFSILSDCKKPHSVQEIMRHLRKQHPQLNKTTVYRQLQTLKNLRITKEICLNDGTRRIELDTGDHHHIVSSVCGNVEHMKRCSMSRLKNRVLAESKNFSSVDTHHLEFFGVCKTCSKRKKRSPVIEQ